MAGIVNLSGRERTVASELATFAGAALGITALGKDATGPAKGC